MPSDTDGLSTFAIPANAAVPGGESWRAGLAALAGGAPETAVPLLRAAAAGAGGGLAALNLGLALMQLGRLAEAVPALEDAARALPSHAEPPFRLGVIAGLGCGTVR